MNEDLPEGMTGSTRRRFLGEVTSVSALLSLPMRRFFPVGSACC
jgi:hypothetical protein